jgi:hypothetical protein
MALVDKLFNNIDYLGTVITDTIKGRDNDIEEIKKILETAMQATNNDEVKSTLKRILNQIKGEL